MRSLEYINTQHLLPLETPSSIRISRLSSTTRTNSLYCLPLPLLYPLYLPFQPLLHYLLQCLLVHVSTSNTRTATTTSVVVNSSRQDTTPLAHSSTKMKTILQTLNQSLSWLPSRWKSHQQKAQLFCLCMKRKLLPPVHMILPARAIPLTAAVPLRTPLIFPLLMKTASSRLHTITYVSIKRCTGVFVLTTTATRIVVATRCAIASWQPRFAQFAQAMSTNTFSPPWRMQY